MATYEKNGWVNDEVDVMQLPRVRPILFTLKILSICPISYDGVHFHAQQRPYGSLLYIGINIASIVLLTAEAMLRESFDGYKRPRSGLLSLVIDLSQISNILFNILTVILVVRDRFQLQKCMTSLQRLWQMNGNRGRSHTALCLTMLVLTAVQFGAHMYIIEGFPLNQLTELAQLTPELWYYGPARILFALVGYWPGMLFICTGRSVLFWIMFLYGSASLCLDSLIAQLFALTNRPRKARHTAGVQVRESVQMLEAFFHNAERLLSVRIFCYLINFSFEAIEALCEVTSRTLNTWQIAGRSSEVLINSLFLILALRNISLCAKKVKGVKKILDLHPLLVANNNLEITLVRLQHIRVQPSAMGFYRIDLKTMTWVVGHVLTYAAILIQYS